MTCEGKLFAFGKARGDLINAFAGSSAVPVIRSDDRALPTVWELEACCDALPQLVAEKGLHLIACGMSQDAAVQRLRERAIAKCLLLTGSAITVRRIERVDPSVSPFEGYGA